MKRSILFVLLLPNGGGLGRVAVKLQIVLRGYWTAIWLEPLYTKGMLATYDFYPEIETESCTSYVSIRPYWISHLKNHD